jgi:hypothetical protein
MTVMTVPTTRLTTKLAGLPAHGAANVANLVLGGSR